MDSGKITNSQEPNGAKRPKTAGVKVANSQRPTLCIKCPELSPEYSAPTAAATPTTGTAKPCRQTQWLSFAWKINKAWAVNQRWKCLSTCRLTIMCLCPRRCMDTLCCHNWQAVLPVTQKTLLFVRVCIRVHEWPAIGKHGKHSPNHSLRLLPDTSVEHYAK